MAMDNKNLEDNQQIVADLQAEIAALKEEMAALKADKEASLDGRKTEAVNEEVNNNEGESTEAIVEENSLEPITEQSSEIDIETSTDEENMLEEDLTELKADESVPAIQAEIVEGELAEPEQQTIAEKSEYENLVDQFNKIYKSVASDQKGKGNGGKGKNFNTNTIVDVINQAVNGSNDTSKKGGSNIAKGTGKSATRGGKGSRGSGMPTSRGGGMSKGGSGRGKGGGKSSGNDVVSSVVSGLTKSTGGKGGGKGGNSNLGVDLASSLIKGASKGGKSSGLGVALSLLSKGMKKR